MRYALAILVLLLIPACADRSHDDTITPVESTGTVSMPAQMLNVFHDGHLYVIVLYQGGAAGGTTLHSPQCPYDPR